MGLESTLCADIQRHKRKASSAEGRQWIIDKSLCGGSAAPLAGLSDSHKHESSTSLEEEAFKTEL